MALDPEVRDSLAASDWARATDLGSYHLPFVGAGRNTWDSWHTGNHGSAVWHASLFGLEACGVRWAGKVKGGGKAARAKLLPRKNVYQLAKEGKAHGETYKTYLNKPENQLNKGIRSFEKRIAEHRDKVANPKKHYLNWHTLAEKNKQGVLRKWKIEVRRFTEEKWIYEGILRDRK